MIQRKVILYPFICLLLFSCGSNANKSSISVIDSTLSSKSIKPSIVKDTIKQEVSSDALDLLCKAIDDDLNKYKTVEKDVWGQSSEGGSAIGYLDGKEVKKIMVTEFGEMGKASSTFYYKNGTLILVNVDESNYDKPITNKNFKIIETVNEKFYFSNSTVIKVLLKGKDESIDEMKWKQLVKDSDKYLKLISSNKE